MLASDLTRGERLVVVRRRAGLSQVKMASKLKTGLRQYRAWERDEDGAPAKSVGKLEMHERCYIARRRSGLERQQLAKRMKCSRLWITLMESGRAPVAALQEYWRRAGAVT